MQEFFVVVVVVVSSPLSEIGAADAEGKTTPESNFTPTGKNMGARASKKLPSPNKCTVQNLADNVLLFVPKKKGKYLPFILLKETTPFARFCVLAESNFENITAIGSSQPPFLNAYNKPYEETTEFVSSSEGEYDNDYAPVDLEEGAHQQIRLDVALSDSDSEAEELAEVGAYAFSTSILSPLETIATDEKQGAWFFVTELSLWFSFSAFLTFQRLAQAQTREDDPTWKAKHAAEANEWFLLNDRFRANVRLFVNDLVRNGQVTTSLQEIRVLLQALNEKETEIFFDEKKS